MSKFWAKCGKVLTDGTKIVRCDNPPCGYYAVFGIKYRSLDQETMEPSNKCYWSYSVAPYEVLNNAIQWNDMYNICLSVNRNVGECLHTKKRAGCHEECVNWDDSGNCIESKETCDFCVEVIVYNLTGCYDKYQDFEARFWGGCGRSPDAQGKYPQIWEVSYGSKQPTGDAHICINEYWNKYFCDRYMPSYNLIYYSKVQWWTLKVQARHEMIEHCICYDGSCDHLEVDPGTPCPDDCQRSCWTEEGDYIDAGPWADQYYGSYETNGTVRHFYGGGLSAWKSPCPWNSSIPRCWVDDCCFMNTLYNSAGPANSFMMGHINKKESYTDASSTTFSCNMSSSLCHNFKYKSYPYDNPYGACDIVRYDIRWATLKLERNANTPESAKGVKFYYKITQAKRNEGYGRASENITTSEGEMSLNFDETYEDLPLANHINGLTLAEPLGCAADCTYGEMYYGHTQPHVTFWNQDEWENDVYTDEVTVALSGIEYI